MEKLRIGIIGCGHWGKNYVRVFSTMKGTWLTAIADLSENTRNRISEVYPSVQTFASHLDLINSGLSDAVVVSTIASTHYEIITAAFKANLDVLAEKPVTLRVDEAEQLCQLADEKQRVFMTAHTFLFNPSVQKVKELLDEGVAGDVYYMKSRRTHLGLIRNDVNAVWDLAPHDISMFMYFLNEKPNQVQALGRRFLRSDREDVAFINLGFPSGPVANIQVSWADSNKERVLDLVGSKSRIVFDDINLQEPIRIFEKGVSVEEGNSDSFGEFKYFFRDGDIISPKIAVKEPLNALCLDFIESLKTRKAHFSDGRFGRDVVEVLCKIDEALKTF